MRGQLRCQTSAEGSFWERGDDGIAPRATGAGPAPATSEWVRPEVVLGDRYATMRRVQHDFDLASARRASAEGKIHEWVQAYLRTGTWINLGLADGLLLAQRWWVGPFEAPLAEFTRKCGPEPEVEYRVPEDDWNCSANAMAGTISAGEQLPPLIVERRGDCWFVADGNHRHEALRRGGFRTCWALGWLNSAEDFQRLRARL